MDPHATDDAVRPRGVAPVRSAPAADEAALAALAAHVGEGLAATETVLRGVTALRVGEAAATSADYADLWRDLGRQVGGKMLRPHLTVAAYLGLGGTDLPAVAHVAAAQEVLHTAMVVHDDLLDHDEVRRGRPNVAGATRARLVSGGSGAGAAAVPPVGDRLEDQVRAAGLLAGDLALAEAFALLAVAPVEPLVRLALVQRLAEGVRTTVAGELLDVRGALRPVLDVDTLAVAHLKTAVYTCGVPLEAGGVLAGAGPEVLAGLRAVGEAMGVAFQLVDDDLGVFGDPAATGKSVLSDLREGKRTELLRTAWAAAGPQDRALLERHVGRADLDEVDAAAVRDVLVRTGAREGTLGLARTLAGRARDVARAVLPQPLADYLAGVVDDLAGRDAGRG
ncbi:polyprenyl synthetase family protein [Cellulomonas endophytica]|uniref:polyprenyl synthetase family protein n=1 Tax=Cellulomonas endophytica TaxID=2494735 RepID=UPI00101320FA|nr:polyprenyl synthetase family protein [Cellulomonas endophytica]